MLSRFSKVAGAVVLAGATAQAAASFDFQRLANLAQAEDADRVVMDGMSEPHRAAGTGPVTPSIVAQPARKGEILAREPAPVRTRSVPQTSAGTRMVLNALDAFEDELRFYAGISEMEIDAAGGAAEKFDPTGNILATLLPRVGEEPESLLNLGRGLAAPVAVQGAGSAISTRSATSGERVNELAFSTLGLGTTYPSRNRIVEPSPVPIPAGLPLLLGGLAAFAALSRRR